MTGLEIKTFYAGRRSGWTAGSGRSRRRGTRTWGYTGETGGYRNVTHSVAHRDGWRVTESGNSRAGVRPACGADVAGFGSDTASPGRRGSKFNRRGIQFHEWKTQVQGYADRRRGEFRAALSEAAGPAFAQDQGLEEITVTGIRGSLQNSMTIKRDTTGIVDAISSEDISASLPDTNLAESLQRITGISIERRDGEGAQVTARGFGPQYNMLTLNGRQIPGADGFSNGDSVIGGTGAGTRAFNFAQLSSDAIAASRFTRDGPGQRAERWHRRNDRHTYRSAAQPRRHGNECRREGGLGRLAGLRQRCNARIVRYFQRIRTMRERGSSASTPATRSATAGPCSRTRTPGTSSVGLALTLPCDPMPSSRTHRNRLSCMPCRTICVTHSWDPIASARMARP